MVLFFRINHYRCLWNVKDLFKNILNSSKSRISSLVADIVLSWYFDIRRSSPALFFMSDRFFDLHSPLSFLKRQRMVFVEVYWYCGAEHLVLWNFNQHSTLSSNLMSLLLCFFPEVICWRLARNGVYEISMFRINPGQGIILPLMLFICKFLCFD